MTNRYISKILIIAFLLLVMIAFANSTNETNQTVATNEFNISYNSTHNNTDLNTSEKIINNTTSERIDESIQKEKDSMHIIIIDKTIDKITLSYQDIKVKKPIFKIINRRIIYLSGGEIRIPTSFIENNTIIELYDSTTRISSIKFDEIELSRKNEQKDENNITKTLIEENKKEDEDKNDNITTTPKTSKSRKIYINKTSQRYHVNNKNTLDVNFNLLAEEILGNIPEEIIYVSSKIINTQGKETTIKEQRTTTGVNITFNENMDAGSYNLVSSIFYNNKSHIHSIPLLVDAIKLKNNTLKIFNKKYNSSIASLRSSSGKKITVEETIINLTTTKIKLLGGSITQLRINTKDITTLENDYIGLDTNISNNTGIKNITWIQAYAIDPSQSNITTIDITATAKGNKLYKCVDWNFTTQTCYGEWTYLRSIIPGENYTITVDTIDPAFGELLNILNVQSYPYINGEWTVQFTTKGTETLRITAVEGTTWSESGINVDLKRPQITCDNIEQPHIWQGNSIVIYNYTCSGESKETSKVLTSGKHKLQFTFGDETLYAQNSAGESGYKVQSGLSSMSTTQLNVSISPLADLTKAFVMRPHYYSAGPDTDAHASNNADAVADSLASAYLSGLSTITIDRGASAEGVYVDWIVVEATNNEFTVDRGSYDWDVTDGLTIDVAIGRTVNANNVFGYITTDTTGTDLENFDTTLFRAYALNSSHLRIQRDVADASTAGTLRWISVEFNLNKIDSIETGTTTLGNSDHTAPLQVSLTTPVDFNESILLYQIGVDDSGLDQVAVAGRMANETTLEFFQDSDGHTRNIRWYVIDFGSNSGSKQNYSYNYYTDNSQYDLAQTLTPSMNKSRTLFFTSATSDGGGTAFPRPFWSAEMTSDTNLQIYRSRLGQPHMNELQLLELPYTAPDTIAPIITTANATPTSQTIGNAIILNATIIENYLVDAVYATISYPDGSIFNYSMSDDNSDTIFNATFNDTFVAGVYNVTIHVNDTANNKDSYTFNFTISYETLEIITDKTSYLRGQNASITVTGFDAYHNITLFVLDETLDPIAGYPIYLASNRTGSFNSTWNIAIDQTLGTYTIRATDENTSKTIDTTVKVVLATIIANSSSYEVGDVLRYDGEDWTPLSNVTISIKNSINTTIYGPLNETANSTGEFNNTWNISWNETYGEYTINGYQTDTPSKNDSMTFTITQRNIILNTDRTFYLFDETVEINSSNYRPGSTVTIDITNGTTSVLGYPKNLTATNGKITDTWKVPRTSNLGTYTIATYDVIYTTVNSTSNFNVELQNVTSDKTTYNSNNEVIISGVYWIPNTNVTISLQNSTGQEQTGYPKNASVDVNGNYQTTWTANIGSGTESNYSIFAYEAHNSSINSTNNFTVKITATVSTNASSYLNNVTTLITGDHYTNNGDVELLIRSLENDNIAPNHPINVTATGSGTISYLWNTTNYCLGTYRVETVDQTQPDILNAQTTFDISNVTTAFSNADFSLGDDTNWQWLGNRYSSTNDCGGGASDINFNTDGIIVLSSANTSYFQGSWEESNNLPVGTGGTEETTLSNSGSDDYAGMIMSTTFIVPANATTINFWGYGEYFSAETNQCLGSRNVGTLNETVNTDRAEMISFGVWVDDNDDTSGNTNIADDFLIFENWESRIESGQTNFLVGPNNYVVDVSAHVGKTIYVTGTIMGDGNSDDALIEIDDITFTVETASCTYFDSEAPDVNNTEPLAGSGYLLNDLVNITANVTDASSIFSVQVELIYPNSTTTTVTLEDVNLDDIYNYSFTDTTILGRYNYTYIANDSRYNSNNEVTGWFTVHDVFAPTYSNINTKPNTPTIYAPGKTYQFNTTWIDNYLLANVTIEHNFTGIMRNNTLNNISDEYYYTYSDLAAGSYVWRMHANDTSGNENNITWQTFVVQQNASNIALELNSISNNITVEVHSTINITATKITGEGIIELYSNNSLINTGLSSLTNLTTIDSIGSYNITTIYVATANYTTSSTTYYITTQDTINPDVNIITPNLGRRILYQEIVNISVNVTDNHAIENVTANITWQGGETNVLLTYNVTSQLFETEYTTTTPGRHNISITAYDAGGNKNTSESSYFIQLDDLTLTTDQSSYIRNDTVSIVATGFNPNVNITINIYNESNISVVGYPKNVTSNFTGSISTTWTIPETQVFAQYTINATDTTNNSRTVETQFDIVSVVIQPVISSSEQGATLWFYGYNWDANTNTSISITNPNNTTIYGPENKTSNASGELYFEWQIPYNATIGVYTIIADDLLTKMDDDTFTVTTRPTNITIEHEWYWNITIAELNGTGYSPNNNITLDITNSSGSMQGYPINLTSNGIGTVNNSINLTAFNSGNYTVTLKDSSYSNLNNNAWIYVTTEQATLNKAIFKNGETITLSGNYWRRSANVTITLRNQTGQIISGYPQEITATTNGDITYNLIADSGTLSKHNYSMVIVDNANSNINTSLNYTVLISAVVQTTENEYDQYMSIPLNGSFFTANGDVTIDIYNKATLKHNYFFPITVQTNSTGEFSYNYNTEDICEGTYVITFTDITNPGELFTNYTYNATHLDETINGESTDAQGITGTYDSTSGSHSDTAVKDNANWHSIAGIDAGTSSAYLNYTFNISSLAISPNRLINLSLETTYCYSGNQGTLVCNTGSNAHEGTANGNQSIEMYNFNSNSWNIMDNLTVNDVNDNEQTTTINILSNAEDYVENDLVHIRYEFNFTRTGFNDDIFLIDYQGLKVTYNKEVNRVCTSFTNNTLTIDLSNGTSEIESSIISIFNSTGELVDKNNATYFKYLVEDNYTITYTIPTNTETTTIKIRDLEFNTITNIVAEHIELYTGTMPTNLANITPIFALNDTGLSYTNAEISLPLNNINVTYVFHCTSWNYISNSCSAWEEDEITIYNATTNATHITFNVTEFDAYGGGPGDSLPNLTSIQIYDVTDEINKDNGGELVKTGVNTIFNLTYENTYRIEFNITNEGRKWTISGEDVAQHAGLNESWNVSSIWYNIGGTNYTGGNFTAGVVNWNTSLGGALNSDQEGTWYYIVEINTSIEEIYAVDFLVNDTSKSSGSTDHSKYNISEPLQIWHTYYGSTSLNITLGDSQNNSIYTWFKPSATGIIYFTDSDASINFANLYALGQNSSLENSTNDFSEIDTALKITGETDSISNIFSLTASTAKETRNFTINEQIIELVPVINSTNSSIFQTGIMWDATSDTTGEYDENETIVFIANVENNLEGLYGIYDYEIKIPFTLQETEGITNSLNVYVELE